MTTLPLNQMFCLPGTSAPVLNASPAISGLPATDFCFVINVINSANGFVYFQAIGPHSENITINTGVISSVFTPGSPPTLWCDVTLTGTGGSFTAFSYFGPLTSVAGDQYQLEINISSSGTTITASENGTSLAQGAHGHIGSGAIDALSNLKFTSSALVGQTQCIGNATLYVGTNTPVGTPLVLLSIPSGGVPSTFLNDAGGTAGPFTYAGTPYYCSTCQGLAPPTGVCGASTLTSVTFEWTPAPPPAPAPASYTLQYRQQGTMTWTVITGLMTTSYVLSGVSPGTTWDWQVDAIYVGGDSGFSAIYDCSTLPATPQPPTGSCGASTQTSVTFNWTPDPNFGAPSSYTLQYRLHGTGPFTTVSGLTSTTYTLSPVASGSSWDWQVQAIYSGLSYTTPFSTIGNCQAMGGTPPPPFVGVVTVGVTVPKFPKS